MAPRSKRLQLLPAAGNRKLRGSRKKGILPTEQLRQHHGSLSLLLWDE